MPPTTRTTTSALPEAIQAHFDGARASLAQDHTMPNLASLVIATRKARGDLSQMGLGTNRTKDGKAKLVTDGTTPADLQSGAKGRLKSGWFSLIANIEQGGRRGDVPDAFVQYIAKVSGVSQARVKELVAEDDKVRAAQAKANEPKTPATANAGSGS